MKQPALTIVDVMLDPEVYGATFGRASWEAWRALLGAFYGLSLTPAQTETVRRLTRRSLDACTSFRELWMPIGRRGGKSHVAALIAVYEAAFRDHRPRLSPGEWATVALIAADRAQARTLLRYVRAMFEHPLLSPLVTRESADGLELRNRAAIEVHTASFRKVRGYTLAAVIADEIAFWQDEGRTPDVEIIAALRPALATLDGRLVAISSPYSRRGALWNTYRRHYGQSESDSVLVAQAPSRTMNPTLPKRLVVEALEEDHARASAEWLAEFRTDIESFISPETYAAIVRSEPLTIPPRHGIEYAAFVDPSGGGADEFGIAIGHVERGGRVVVNLVVGRRGSPAGIVEEYVKLLREYRINSVRGDRYAAEWPRQEFRRHGVQYHDAPGVRSELYLTTLPAIQSGRVELPSCQTLERQFLGLERRTSRGGRDTIDHAPGRSDDRANAVAGLVAHLVAKRNTPPVMIGTYGSA